MSKYFISFYLCFNKFCLGFFVRCQSSWLYILINMPNLVDRLISDHFYETKKPTRCWIVTLELLSIKFLYSFWNSTIIIIIFCGGRMFIIKKTLYAWFERWVQNTNENVFLFFFVVAHFKLNEHCTEMDCISVCSLACV